MPHIMPVLDCRARALSPSGKILARQQRKGGRFIEIGRKDCPRRLCASTDSLLAAGISVMSR